MLHRSQAAFNRAISTLLSNQPIFKNISSLFKNKIAKYLSKQKSEKQVERKHSQLKTFSFVVNFFW